MAERFCFLVDWFDAHAQLSRDYLLYYCAADKTVEMFDLKARRNFLKRTRYEELRLEDFYIGAAVNIYSRQLIIRDFGDVFTANKFQKKLKRAFFFIKPQAYQSMGEILDQIGDKGFTISRLRMLDFRSKELQQLFGSDEVPRDVARCVAVEVLKENAVEELKNTTKASSSLSKLIASDNKASQLFLADNDAEAIKCIDSVFGGEAEKKFPRTATFEKSTLGVIKPHAVNTNQIGKMVSDVLKGGFQITDMEIFHLEKANAEEFLEVYKDVVIEYHVGDRVKDSMINHSLVLKTLFLQQKLMLDQFTSGKLVAMEISGDHQNIVSEFRNFCGPSDPELAKKLRPDSIRSKFGIDKVKNSIHCTDLPDDGELEVHYFFKILVS